MKSHNKVYRNVQAQKTSPKQQVQGKALYENACEMRVRRWIAQQGFKLMHRRREQYWMMFDHPMTLPEIELWIEDRGAAIGGSP